MRKKEVTPNISKIKNPERRWNAVYTHIIVSVLWSSLVAVVGMMYKNMQSDFRDLKIEVVVKDKKIDALNAEKYQYVLQQLDYERQQKEVKYFIDSMTHVQADINKTLRMK